MLIELARQTTLDASCIHTSSDVSNTMKIEDYKIATEPEIKKMLLEGWEPYGSPFLGYSGTNVYQAMVKWSKK